MWTNDDIIGLETKLFASETACAECLAKNARLAAERDEALRLLHSQIATCEALQAELQATQIVTFDRDEMIAAMQKDIAEIAEDQKRQWKTKPGSGIFGEPE